MAEEQFNLSGLGDDLSLDLDDQFLEIKDPPEEDIDDKEKNNSSDSPEKEKESVASEEDKVNTHAEEGQSSSPQADDETLSAIYSSLAEHVHDAGVLPSLNLEETPIKNADDLAKAVQREIDNSLDEIHKNYNDAMKAGVSQDDYAVYQQTMQQLDSINDEVLGKEENANLRMEIIARDFINKGFDENTAIKYAKRSIDLNEDIIDAKAALERLKENTKSQYQSRLDEAKKKEEKALDDIKSFIDKTDEVIKGVKISKLAKDKLYSQITTPVTRSADGKPVNAYARDYVKDPVKMRVMSEYLYMITNGYTDFSTINKSVETRVSKSLDNLLKNNGAGFLGGGGVNFDNKDNNSQFSLGDGLELDV